MCLPEAPLPGDCADHTGRNNPRVPATRAGATGLTEARSCLQEREACEASEGVGECCLQGGLELGGLVGNVSRGLEEAAFYVGHKLVEDVLLRARAVELADELAVEFAKLDQLVQKRSHAGVLLRLMTGHRKGFGTL